MIGPEAQSLLYSAQRPGLRGYPSKVMQVPNRLLWGKASFSKRVVKYCNMLPTPIVTAHSKNSFKRQLNSVGKELFAEVP